MEYLALRTESASTSILQASIDTRRTSKKGKFRYDDVRVQVVNDGRLTYSYLGAFDREDGKRRLERADGGANRFSIRLLDRKTISLLNFVVFDHDEVVARQPYEHPNPPVYLVMRGREVAELFSGYFARLWNEAKDPSDVEAQASPGALI